MSAPTCDEPDDACLGEKGWVKYVDNKQGLTLCRYFWPADRKPKAVVLLVHGHACYAQFEFLNIRAPGELGSYKGSFVENLNKNGVSVCALDLQSHGRSEGANGLRCYAKAFQDHVDDVTELARWVAQSKDAPGFSQLPLFILGISLGGCIAVHAIHQQGKLFKGAVLLAPMLSLEKVSKQGLNPYLRPLASVLSRFVPTLPVAEVKKNVMFPDIQESFDKDPNCWHKNTRARVATDYLAATEQTCKSMKDMNYPFLVVHSSKDDMTDPAGSQQLFDQSQSDDKSIEIIDDMWHFLLKEPGTEKVQELAINWINARV